MGSSSLMDIIGSFFIAGLLFLSAWRLDSRAIETSHMHFSNAILQGNITAMAANIETDFRKIAYCRNWRLINPPSMAIRIADSNKFRFWTDIDNNGVLDSITYWIGPTNDTIVSKTPNPNDRLIYRQVNNTTAQKLNLGATQFSFRYRNIFEDYLPFPITGSALQQVYIVELSVVLQSPAPMVQEYSNDTSEYQVFWKQIRLASRNFDNR